MKSKLLIYFYFHLVTSKACKPDAFHQCGTLMLT